MVDVVERLVETSDSGAAWAVLGERRDCPNQRREGAGSGAGSGAGGGGGARWDGCDDDDGALGALGDRARAASLGGVGRGRRGLMERVSGKLSLGV